MIEEKEDLLYTIALTGIKGVGSIYARRLIETFGSAQAVFDANLHIIDSIPRIGKALLSGITQKETMERAKREIDFIDRHKIKVALYGSANYPSKLLECQDSPAILYYSGQKCWESRHIISIVGTRRCTHYGRELIENFMKQISSAIPDIVIVSGLALGVDGTAHKEALKNNLPTIGIIAHGLDRIYPSIHRNMARQMATSGGCILSEYPSGTAPEKGNFLARNRIIAGISSATIIVESADKGGSLVTASIANSYNRDVFAFPGRVNDERSKGCNRLIRTNLAGLITNAEDFISSIGWEKEQDITIVEQKIPFDTLSPNGLKILNLLQSHDSLAINEMTEMTGISIPVLSEELLDLEMNDFIRRIPGSRYAKR